MVFDELILKILHSHIASNESFVAVNTCKVAEEEVKYILKDNYIDKLSKEVKNGLGEAVGINFISSKDIKSFIQRLEECDDNDYLEKGLEMAIELDAICVKPIDITKYSCVEADFTEDLENENKIFSMLLEFLSL